MHTELLFPTPITISIIENFYRHKDDIIQWVYEYRERNPNSDASYGQRIWESESKTVFDDEDFVEFINLITNSISLAAKSMELNLNAVSMDKMWITIISKYGYIGSHINEDTEISGIIWINCDEESGNLIFKNPTSLKREKVISYFSEDYSTKNNLYHQYTVQPKEGAIVLYPSYLPVQLEQNNGNSESILIQFGLNMED